MNMPNFAACHHCMRRTWSAVGAELLSTACANAASVCPASARPASDAPVPSSICRRLISGSFIGNLLGVKPFPQFHAVVCIVLLQCRAFSCIVSHALHEPCLEHERQRVLQLYRLQLHFARFR